ncbi:membrane protease YdiL (CAAX protease family) [Bacillus oleivorans]|uniref:Membrane protease YdiL (CAAX protease family) n=1 Tax=Bacillus oleivorans TaxID=1448271 RepID=A0A285CKP3_9BACI|nr:CPBP family intramembrane glutamic endopeptidase [Bacillus oleivorans]SNX68110.1 membrane protease YdiL (CAAX protease family) [Bacillus oleivorans]
MKKQSEIIKSLTDRQLLINLYATQLIILVITIILSFVFFGDLSTLFLLIKWNDGAAYLIGFIAGLLVVGLDVLMARLLPPQFFDDGGINERIFLKRHPLHILFLAVIIGVSEELLFRGILQNTLGWFWASLIFALIHFRYLSHWYLSLNITLLSLFIGYVYILSENLIAPIILHITVDFLLGLFLKIQKKVKKKVSRTLEMEHRQPDNVGKPGALPPRSLVHKNKRKNKKAKVKVKEQQMDDQQTDQQEVPKKRILKYPLIRLLAFLFILLPLTIIYFYAYWMSERNIDNPASQETYFEPIQLDGSNNK